MLNFSFTGLTTRTIAKLSDLASFVEPPVQELSVIHPKIAETSMIIEGSCVFIGLMFNEVERY
jgi:hypothetical protein